MIRRDYIVRMIEQFMQVLSRIRALKKEKDWRGAVTTLDEELQRLIGADAEGISQVPETELLARLIQREPTQPVDQKTMMLTTLLKEAGDLAAAQSLIAQSNACYLKGLHLLLLTLAQSDAQA